MTRVRRLTKVGLAVSALWVLGYLVLLVVKRDAMSSMALNEWGDFLAGASAPLALLWLVIGYFQHGEELRLNTKVLRAQEDELRRQVEETATLARNAKRQAQAAESLVRFSEEQQQRETERKRREAQPDFVPSGGSGVIGNQHSIHIVNRGGLAKDIEITHGGPNSMSFSSNRRLESGAKAQLLLLERRSPIQWPLRLELTYTDEFGDRQARKFEWHEGNDLREM